MNSWSIAQRMMNYEKGSFVRFILKLGYWCTGLSVAVMIIAFAVISGFNKEISTKIFGIWGHIQVNSIHSSQLNVSDPIDFDSAFVSSLDSIQGIKHHQIFAFMPGVITTKTEMDGLILKGVNKDFDWSSFNNFIIKGHPIQFTDSVSRDIILSQVVSSRLKLNAGDRCRINFVINEEVVPRMFDVVGIYNTGLEEYDRKLAIVDIQLIRDLNNWSDIEVGGYEIFVDDIKKVDQIADEIYEKHLKSDMYIETIKQKFPSIFDWLNLQSTNQYVVLGLMLAVALINIITVLLILILERTKMIGVLKALGTKNRLLKKVFLLHGTHILVKGLLLGNALGFVICLIQKYGKVIKLNEADYYLSVAPIHFNLFSIVLLNIGVVSITFIFLIIPTILISKITPIKAIGYR